MSSFVASALKSAICRSEKNTVVLRFAMRILYAQRMHLASAIYTATVAAIPVSSGALDALAFETERWLFWLSEL